VVFYRQKEWNNYTERYCKIRQQLYSRYVPIKLLIANTFRLLFTYNAEPIRDLTSLESWRTFTESVVIFRFFQMRRQFTNVVNTSSA